MKELQEHPEELAQFCMVSEGVGVVPVTSTSHSLAPTTQVPHLSRLLIKIAQAVASHMGRGSTQLHVW